MVGLDLDQQIARLERILSKRIPTPDGSGQQELKAKLHPNQVKSIEAQMAAIATVISEYLAENVLPVLQELQDMRRRVSAIEDRGIKYCGIYQRYLDYKRGDIVTCDGAMWIATVNSTGVKPGGDAAVWLMTSKSHGKAALGERK
jgi:hypothetical protein